MTVTVFIAFIMGIGAVIAVPAGRFHYRSRTVEVVSHYILKTTQSINTIWVFLFSSEPAKGNSARLSISADEVPAGMFHTLHSGGSLSDYMITWKLQNDYLAYLFYMNPYPDPFAGDYSRVCNHVLPPFSPF